MYSQNSVLCGPLESLFVGLCHQAYIQLGSLVSICFFNFRNCFFFWFVLLIYIIYPNSTVNTILQITARYVLLSFRFLYPLPSSFFMFLFYFSIHSFCRYKQVCILRHIQFLFSYIKLAYCICGTVPCFFFCHFLEIALWAYVIFLSLFLACGCHSLFNALPTPNDRHLDSLQSVLLQKWCNAHVIAHHYIRTDPRRGILGQSVHAVLLVTAQFPSIALLLHDHQPCLRLFLCRTRTFTIGFMFSSISVDFRPVF